MIPIEEASILWRCGLYGAAHSEGFLTWTAMTLTPVAIVGSQFLGFLHPHENICMRLCTTIFLVFEEDGCNFAAGHERFFERGTGRYDCHGPLCERASFGHPLAPNQCIQISWSRLWSTENHLSPQQLF